MASSSKRHRRFDESEEEEEERGRHRRDEKDEEEEEDEDEDEEEEEEEEEEDRAELSFSCRMESAKELHSLLSCLANFKGPKKDQYALVEVSPKEAS